MYRVSKAQEVRAGEKIQNLNEQASGPEMCLIEFIQSDHRGAFEFKTKEFGTLS